MTIENIAVIGVGQLGMRHFQALLKAPGVKRIWLVDPSEQALDRAVQSASTPATEVHCVGSPRDVPKDIHFAVVATNSLDRRDAVEALLETTSVRRLLLEKFLFPRLADYDAVARVLEEREARAWVNCARRMYPFYRELRERIGEGDSVAIHVSASNTMIGSNAIHFLDLLAFLTRRPDVEGVDTGGLHKRAYASKRAGYTEFHGTLIARAGGHSLVFQKLEQGGFPLQIVIASGAGRYVVMENDQTVRRCPDGSDGEWRSAPFPKPLQSELTQHVVAQLNERDECDLTPYAEGSRLHRRLLDPLLTFQKEALGMSGDVCAIT